MQVLTGLHDCGTDSDSVLGTGISSYSQKTGFARSLAVLHVSVRTCNWTTLGMSGASSHRVLFVGTLP
jgi:hypothetical protein